MRRSRSSSAAGHVGAEQRGEWRHALLLFFAQPFKSTPLGRALRFHSCRVGLGAKNLAEQLGELIDFVGGEACLEP